MSARTCLGPYTDLQMLLQQHVPDAAARLAIIDAASQWVITERDDALAQARGLPPMRDHRRVFDDAGRYGLARTAPVLLEEPTGAPA